MNKHSRRIAMKKYSRKNVFLSLVIMSGLAFVVISLFASLLCFQKTPNTIRKDGVRLEGVVLKKTRSVLLFKGTSRTSYYLDLEIMGVSAERSRIRVHIGGKPFDKFKEGEVVPVWRYKSLYRVDKYGAMNIISPLPFFVVACAAFVLFTVFIRKFRGL